MEFLQHCNRCGWFMGLGAEVRTLYITSCFHTLCQNCNSCTNCPICKGAFQSVEINSQLKPGLAMYFMDPQLIIREGLVKSATALEFQKVQAQRFKMLTQSLADSQMKLPGEKRALLDKIKSLEKEKKEIQKKMDDFKHQAGKCWYEGYSLTYSAFPETYNYAPAACASTQKGFVDVDNSTKGKSNGSYLPPSTLGTFFNQSPLNGRDSTGTDAQTRPLISPSTLGGKWGSFVGGKDSGRASMNTSPDDEMPRRNELFSTVQGDRSSDSIRSTPSSDILDGLRELQVHCSTSSASSTPDPITKPNF